MEFSQNTHKWVLIYNLMVWRQWWRCRFVPFKEILNFLFLIKLQQYTTHMLRYNRKRVKNIASLFSITIVRVSAHNQKASRAEMYSFVMEFCHGLKLIFIHITFLLFQCNCLQLFVTLTKSLKEVRRERVQRKHINAVIVSLPFDVNWIFCWKNIIHSDIQATFHFNCNIRAVAISLQDFTIWKENKKVKKIVSNFYNIKNVMFGYDFVNLYSCCIELALWHKQRLTLTQIFYK